MTSPQQMRTIHVGNLNEKTRIYELKYALRSKFSGLGRIVAISASKRLKLRGQAFITFERAESAERAVKWMQGKPFLGQPLRVYFAMQEMKAAEMVRREIKLEPDQVAAVKLAAMEIDAEGRASRGEIEMEPTRETHRLEDNMRCR